MRLWSLNPKYLDAKGLVALWREGLLAQKVLLGKTKGYRNHPQLDRFKQHADAKAAIGFYLKKVHEEAVKRGYSFDFDRVTTYIGRVNLIKLTKGQLAFELRHLTGKLRQRDICRYRAIVLIKQARPHPLFKVIQGDIAIWEK